MSAIGPMFGQVGFFHKFAGREFEDKRPLQRYVNESKRLLGVLDKHLDGRQWMMGDEYSIADIASLGWVRNLIGFYGARRAGRVRQLYARHGVAGARPGTTGGAARAGDSEKAVRGEIRRAKLFTKTNVHDLFLVGFRWVPVDGQRCRRVCGTWFFGVVPPADAASRIYRLGEVIKCARQFQGVLTSRDCLHVTLFFLGEVSHLSDRSIRSAFEAGAEVKMEPFEISFDRSMSFRGSPAIIRSCCCAATDCTG